jgi:cytochrome d ubiquinol oxidase subunit I
MVAGFIVAGVYAVGWLRGRRDRYHRLGLTIPLTVAAIATPVQIYVGDVAARAVFEREPAKFAAIEMVPTTSTHVPEVLGGVLDHGEVRYGIPIPGFASWLSGWSSDTRILGLDAIPPPVRPPDHLVTIVHLAFDVMVGISFLLLLLSAWFALSWWRRRSFPENRWFLRLTAVAGVLTVVALEAGWVVTEVGRQPWTVVGLLLTRDAVTRSGNVWLFFAATLVLYAAVAYGTFLALRWIRRRWRASDEAEAETGLPYGPPPSREAETTGGRAR